MKQCLCIICTTESVIDGQYSIFHTQCQGVAIVNGRSCIHHASKKDLELHLLKERVKQTLDITPPEVYSSS